MISNQLISVIVPAFNASSTLENCFNSLLLQTFLNFEIIFINDGSTDDTLNKALHFAEINKRVKVFNQENIGVSATRNRGLELATGDYFCFVDADDTVSSNYLENLVNGISEKDGSSGLVIQQLRFLTKSGEEIESNCPMFFDLVVAKDSYSFLFEEQQIVKYGYNCGKLFKLKTVRDNNITYNKAISISEDLIFMLEYLYYSDYVHFIGGADYNYITTSYTLGDTKFASLSSEKELLKEYLLKVNKLKSRFNISDHSLFSTYNNAGDIFMRLIYSMYRLNNTLPKKGQRLENIKKAVTEFEICLKKYFVPVGMKEKITKFLLLNKYYTLFDIYRLYVLKSQANRFKNI